jgi:rod shape-determining protein MreC
MLKRQHYIALAVVVLMTLTVLNLPLAFTARLKQALGTLFLPLFGVAASTHQLASDAGEALSSRSTLLKENEALRRENERLHVQEVQMETVLRENARLRQFVGWKQQVRWNVKLARVVLHDPSNLWRSVQIDLGSRDGLTNNLAVLTPDGFLAGRVTGVSFTRAQVLLLGDPNCKVAARIEETGDLGTLAVSGPLDTALLPLVFPFRNSNLKAGQTVLTSGIGGIFPRGIPIGKIVDSVDVEYGLYTEARVKPGANLNGLEEVWVLLP